MKKLSLLRTGTVAALLACATFPAFAAQPPATQASAAQWEIALKAREQRATGLRDEVKGLDALIESRMDGIIQALQLIGDSKDTKSKVARMKRETIDSLQKTIAYYQQKRAALLEDLRRPTSNLTAEQKKTVIAKFDERIEKRITQILELQKSMPTHKDYDRYEVTGSNWYGTTYQMSDDYQQNLRLTTQSNYQRTEIVKALRAAIARLEQQNRALKADGAPAAEIAKNDALLAERRQQLATALAPVETPTRAIGRKEAAELDQALQLAVKDLQRDFNTLFSRYNALIQEVGAVNTARAGLAAAQAKTAKP